MKNSIRQISTLRRALLEWFVTQQRDLPWRRTGDPYLIWVSEVMLQQTRVSTVIPYFESFVGRYPDVLTLARSDLQAVLKSWEGLGYYARARNLHKAAKTIVEQRRSRSTARSFAREFMPFVAT